MRMFVVILGIRGCDLISVSPTAEQRHLSTPSHTDVSDSGRTSCSGLQIPSDAIHARKWMTNSFFHSQLMILWIPITCSPQHNFLSLQSFGFEHMLTFHNLRKLGMLTEVEQSQASRNLGKMAAVANVNLPKSGQFRNLCKKLHLVGDCSLSIVWFSSCSYRSQSQLMTSIYATPTTCLMCTVVHTHH